MPNQASVFISYSRRDKAFAEKLNAAFERAERKAWIDTEDIRPTSRWSNEIAAAIDGADVIVFVLSPDFAASAECAKEIEHAAKQNKRLIPVVARAVEPRTVSASLAELQWISFVDETRFETTFELLCQAIDTDLDWVTEHTRYHLRAVEWDTAGRPASLVLRGKELKQAELWLTKGGTKKPEPSLLQSQFVAAGRHAATRRQRVVAGALTTGLFVSIVLAIFAFIQRNAARQARDEAVHRLYTLQLTRASDLVNRDPDRAVDVLDATLRTAGGLREFAWDLYRRLSDRTLLALGGMWNNDNTASEGARPVLALSHDGRFLATASVRHTKWEHSDHSFVAEINVWDLASGARHSTLSLKENRHQSDLRVQAISFAPDGRSLAASAGLSPSILKVWDVATGDELMATQSRFVEFVAQTPSSLIGIQEFGEVNVWDIAHPNAAGRRFMGSSPGAAAWRPGSTELYMMDPKEIVRWNIATGERNAWTNPAGIQHSVAISPKGNRIARVDFDAVSVWKASSGADWTLEWTLKGGHAETVTSIAFSPDGRMLASGGNDNTVQLWDLDRGVAIRTLRGPKDDVTALAFSGDGRRLTAGGADATVFVWDVEGLPERPAQRIEIAGRSDCFAYSAGGNSIAVTPEGKAVLRTTDGSARELATSAEKGPDQCGISQRGDVMFYMEGDSRVRLWNVAEEKSTVIGPVSGLRSVRLSPLGDVVAAFVTTNSIGLWNAKSGEMAGTIQTDGAAGLPLDFMDDTLLVSHVRKDDQTRITLFDTKERKALTSVTIKAGDPQVFAHCRRQRVFAAVEDEKLRIVNLRTGTVLHDLPWYKRDLFLPLRRVSALAFSPDCTTLLIGDDMGEISSWDVTTGQRRFTIEAHTGAVVSETRSAKRIGVRTESTSNGVTALMFSPDGRTIASSGGSPRGRGELRLWNADRGERLADVSVTSGFVTSLKFSPDGTGLSVVHEPSSEDSDRRPKILELWRTRGSDELGLFAAHTMPITRLKFSPDSTRLLTETEDETKVWDVFRRESVSAEGDWMSQTAPPETRAARSPNGRLRVEFQGQFLLLFRGSEPGPQALKSENRDQYFHSQPIESIHMLRDGRLISLASGQENQPAELVLWNLEEGRPMREAYEPANTISSLVFSPDEQLFVTTGAVGPILDHPGIVHIWDTHELRQVQSLVGHRSRVQAAAFSPDGKRLATGDIEGFVRIWDVSRFAKH